MQKAILFNVDGTLAQTEEFHRRAWNSAFVRHGIDANGSVAEYRELLQVTGGKERLEAYFRARGLAMSERDRQPVHRSNNDLDAQSLESGLAGFRPGGLRRMREAREAGCRLSIATTTSLVNVDALLRLPIGADGKQVFFAVIAGDQAAKKKPALDVYERCLALLHIAPGQALADRRFASGCGRGAPSRYPRADDAQRVHGRRGFLPVRRAGARSGGSGRAVGAGRGGIFPALGRVGRLQR